MTIHSPKHISSSQGLGLNTVKEMVFLNDNVAIGIERWNKLDESWSESGVIIAQEGYSWITKWETGKPYIITKFLNETGDIVGIYCDVSTPVERTDESFAFIDLYLDVWQVPGQSPVILDEDELRKAISAKYVSKEDADSAQYVAEQLIEELINNSEFLNF